MWLLKRFFELKRVLVLSFGIAFILQGPYGLAAAKKNVLVSSEFDYSKTRTMPVSCIGPEDAEHFMVYLHGADLGKIGPYERENRQALESIANALKIRIAVPRSPQLCSGTVIGEVCWWVFEHPELVSKTMTQVIDSREQCFSRSQPYGVLGFSNGGYLLNHWVTRTQCSFSTQKKRELPDWMISFSAVSGEIDDDLQSLAQAECPALQHVIGDRDLNNYSERYYNRLKNLGTNLIPIHVFKGKHELEPTALYQVLETMLNSQKNHSI